MGEYQRKPQTNVAAEPLLSRRTEQIVALRGDGLLLWEIAERVGVTKERIRQILAEARAQGREEAPPKQVVTRRALLLMGMSPEMRPSSFQRLMARLAIFPVVKKRGRLYWNVESLLNIEPPRCVVCQSPIPLSRYTRSVTCSPYCSTDRRSRQPRGETRVPNRKTRDLSPVV